MNKGLEILMARIESNPEEFMSNGIVANRWEHLLTTYSKVLPEEDLNAFYAKLNEKSCERFTELVMQELLDPKSKTEAQVSAMPSGGMTPSPFAQQDYNNLHNQNLTGASQGFLSSLFGGVK